MKTGALISAAIITVILLIVALQNVTTTANVVFLFGTWNAKLILPLLLVTILAMGAGALYTISIQAMLDKAERDADGEVDRF